MPKDKKPFSLGSLRKREEATFSPINHTSSASALDNKTSDEERSRRASEILWSLSPEKRDQLASGLAEALKQHKPRKEKEEIESEEEEIWTEEEIGSEEEIWSEEEPHHSTTTATSSITHNNDFDTRSPTKVSIESGIGNSINSDMASHASSTISLATSASSLSSPKKPNYDNIFNHALKTKLKADKTFSKKSHSTKEHLQLYNALTESVYGDINVKEELIMQLQAYSKRKPSKSESCNRLITIIKNIDRPETSSKQALEDQASSITSNTLRSWAHFIIDCKFPAKSTTTKSSVSSPVKSAPLPPPQSTKPKLVIEESESEVGNTFDVARHSLMEELEAILSKQTETPKSETPRKVGPGPLKPKPNRPQILEDQVTGAVTDAQPMQKQKPPVPPKPGRLRIIDTNLNNVDSNPAISPTLGHN